MEERPPVWRVAENILNKTVADGRQGVTLQRGGLRQMETILHRKNWSCYETDACTSGLDRSFGAKMHEIWYMECKEHVWVRASYGSSQGISEV
jgi:hypothetical protein